RRVDLYRGARPVRHRRLASSPQRALVDDPPAHLPNPVRDRWPASVLAVPARARAAPRGLSVPAVCAGSPPQRRSTGAGRDAESAVPRPGLRKYHLGVPDRFRRFGVLRAARHAAPRPAIGVHRPAGWSVGRAARSLDVLRDWPVLLRRPGHRPRARPRSAPPAGRTRHSGGRLPRLVRDIWRLGDRRPSLAADDGGAAVTAELRPIWGGFRPGRSGRAVEPVGG